jgi:hypothetical protein
MAQSTCEAEYYSAADATKAGLHLRQLMEEIFNYPINEPTTILEDNQSAIAYSENALVSEKTKHIGRKWHFLKDHVEQETIKLRYLPTDQMVDDMFSPSLSHDPHWQDTEVQYLEDKTQCNVVSRSYL